MYFLIENNITTDHSDLFQLRYFLNAFFIFSH